MEMIQHKSYGPVAALKRSFRKQIVLMIIMPLILIVTNADYMSKIFSSIMFWSYVAFCLGVIIFSYFNYRIVNKMQDMDETVKSTLNQQINLLETRLKWNIIGVRIVLLFFVILTEVLPYFQHYRMLDKWHALHPAVRFGIYAGFFILQYFLSRMVSQRRYGRHIAYLKELSNEMQG